VPCLKVFLVLGLLVAPTVSRAATFPPHVKVSMVSPKMVVRGTGFEAHEWVTVTVAGQGVKKSRVRATLAGAFRVAVTPPPAATCGRYFVRAHGLSSSRTATLRLGPPECADPSPPRG
jgi:hypothetical protein